MSEGRVLIETTCLGDDVRSYIDPQTLERSTGAVLEMGDGKGNWWPIGTVGNIEDLGPVEAAEPAHVCNVGTVGHVDHGGRVIIVTGAGSELYAPLIEQFVGHDVRIIAVDEMRDDVNLLDFSVSGTLEMSAEDGEAMRAFCQRVMAPMVYAVEQDMSGPRRGKKGKYKKDWQR